jgi:hypothetical protein
MAVRRSELGSASGSGGFPRPTMGIGTGTRHDPVRQLLLPLTDNHYREAIAATTPEHQYPPTATYSSAAPTAH